MYLNFVVSFYIEPDRKQHRDDLTENGSECGTGCAHFRKTEVTEDQDRVKDNIQDGARSLRDHRVKRAAGGLQQTFQRDLEKQADRKATDDRHILHAVLNDLGIVGLHGEKRP